MIKLQVIGNLGKDCTTNNVNGRTVMNFNVAHTERFKDAQGNQQERTTWVECAYWTDRTAVADYLKKGKMVYAEGAPSADPYQNKEGQPAATLRMRVQTVQLLGGSNESGSNQGNVTNYGNSNNPTVKNQEPSAQVASPVSAPADDLPF